MKTIEHCIHGVPLTVFCEPCGTGRDVRTVYRSDPRDDCPWKCATDAAFCLCRDYAPRGVPAYHPTEHQPTRVGGAET